MNEPSMDVNPTVTNIDPSNNNLKNLQRRITPE